MSPLEKLHAHHEKLIGTIKSLADRGKKHPADTSLLLAYCNEYLISHAEAEEVTLYTADEDPDFINNMIHEHKEIKHSLDIIDAAFSRAEIEDVAPEISEFISLLDKHFNEEEHTLMPRIARRLSEEELGSLIEEAHQIESEKKKSDVWALFEYDHKRIDLNLSELKASKENRQKSEEFYSGMRNQLLKHIELEETVLFPAFAEHTTPDHMGPVNVMIEEHRGITACISTPADRRNDAEISGVIEDLTGRLAVHNKKEELILYPMINRELPRAEKERVFKACFDEFVKV